jgi:hypothetical protein
VVVAEEVDMAVKVEMELEEEELHEERRKELAGRSSQARRSLSRRPPLPLPFIESIGAICLAMAMALAC